MRPICLTMQAFGSYGRKTTVDFTVTTQNLFLITGDTGAGKTTIFDAIVFALYGEASSGNNKKNGMELQSQFVDCEVQPFVELTFSEGERQYTVRRVPRHLRPLKKGHGTKEEKEHVCLTMPDGREFSQNQRETDQKLEEIVGLTKAQFMQIAMIAQGEFMELLRAESQKKKEIFRKLFDTGIYQSVVEELFRRKKEKQTEMAQIQTICQAEVRRTVIPASYACAEDMEACRQSLCVSDRLNAAELEAFTQQLEALCGWTSEQLRQREAACEEAGRTRDERRDALTHGRTLLTAFEQLEQAEQELAVCRTQAGEMAELSALADTVQAAYELKGVYGRLQDAAHRADETSLQWETQKAALPGLTAAWEQARQSEQAARAALDGELETYTRVSEGVKKALHIFSCMHSAEQSVQVQERACAEACRNNGEAEKNLTTFEQQETAWRQQADGLAGAEAELAHWEGTNQAFQRLSQELEEAGRMQQEVTAQRRKAQQAGQDYAVSRQAFAEKNREYLQMQNDFLDAQAGFLARESLREGEPCPVCGSVEHPRPCVLSDKHAGLTREAVEQLAKEAAALQEAQTERSAAAGAAADLLTEKQAQLKSTLEKLRSRMEQCGLELPAQLTLRQAEELLHAWEQRLRQEGAQLRKQVETLRQLQTRLRTAEQDRQSLRARAEQARQSYFQAQTALATARETLKGWQAQQTYASAEAAAAALAQAEAEKTEKSRAYGQAQMAMSQAKTARETAETLIDRCARDYPAQEETRRQRQADYDGLLADKHLTQQQWQTLTERYAPSQPGLMHKTVQDFQLRRAAAEAAARTAQQTIGEREKPELSRLEQARQEAEEALRLAQRAMEQLRQVDHGNRNAWEALRSQLTERSDKMQEFTRLDSLYNRLSGKVTGARMDIETFVQRYYLRRILHAANQRFRSMSAGQFELRMVDADQAGEGRNRGLDLMVYSAVTGREREVRTLSGGESFMAALSLALGMADQLQENTASIHLDMMFIDEGFGSLDDHSRTQAVKVLQQMAGGSKLIGIISHVTELKQEIEDQLLVTKTEEGSRVRWVIS